MAKTIRTTGKKEARRTSSKVAPVKAKKAFSNYKEALAYLLDRTDYEKEEHVRYNVTTFSLARMERLLSLLGDPHTKINTVHIAGTKGKGSTATMWPGCSKPTGTRSVCILRPIWCICTSGSWSIRG
jgi:dihydrofolate synthase/folylpolyglutamate synthase